MFCGTKPVPGHDWLDIGRPTAGAAWPQRYDTSAAVGVWTLIDTATVTQHASKSRWRDRSCAGVVGTCGVSERWKHGRVSSDIASSINWLTWSHYFLPPAANQLQPVSQSVLHCVVHCPVQVSQSVNVAADEMSMWRVSCCDVCRHEHCCRDDSVSRRLGSAAGRSTLLHITLITYHCTSYRSSPNSSYQKKICSTN